MLHQEPEDVTHMILLTLFFEAQSSDNLQGFLHIILMISISYIIYDPRPPYLCLERNVLLWRLSEDI